MFIHTHRNFTQAHLKVFLHLQRFEIQNNSTFLKKIAIWDNNYNGNKNLNSSSLSINSTKLPFYFCFLFQNKNTKWANMCQNLASKWENKRKNPLSLTSRKFIYKKKREKKIPLSNRIQLTIHYTNKHFVVVIYHSM